MRAATEGIGARLSLERALAGVGDAAVGELLVMRRLAPSAPLALGSGPPVRFRQAVERGLAEGRARARRPWTDPDAATAEAALFGGEAELLACMARDWLSGRGEAWYWRALLGSRPVEAALFASLRDEAVSIAPALAMLADRGLAVPFVARLPDPVAAAALASLASVHGLPLAVAPGSPAPPLAAAPGSPGPAPGPARTARRAARPAQAALARLRELVPEAASPRLTAPQRRLLGVALAVARAPGLLHGPAAPVVLAVLAGADDRGPPRAYDGVPGPSPTDHERIVPPPAGPAPRDGAFGAAPVRPDGRSAAVSRGAADSTAGPPPPAATTLVPEPARPRPERLATRAAATPPVPRRANPRLPTPRRAGDVDAPAPAPVPDPGVATGLGGLFYLVNVAQAFGLYGDFTQPRAPGIALSPWDLLALAAERWFGEAAREDPVWTLLAALAGRARSEAPGAGFTPPVDWSAPPDWLPPGRPVAVALAHATRRRLRLLHPDGFVLAEAARAPGAPPLVQARALADAFPALRRARLRRAKAGGVPASPRARWLEAVLGGFAARLASALAVRPADAPALLCRHRAVVIADAEAVRVHLLLAELPIEIRLAGLDRDPGWIPAAGRSLFFRFT